MKKALFALLIVAALCVFTTSTALAGDYGYMEPAPNAGDGDPDGSGFSFDVGSELAGPAPSAGDGIPEGSGF